MNGESSFFKFLSPDFSIDTLLQDIQYFLLKKENIFLFKIVIFYVQYNDMYVL